MAERMSNADNFWLCMDEPTNLMVITGLWSLKRPLDFNRLCHHREPAGVISALSEKNRVAEIRVGVADLGG
jgi:hypothetical protein